MRPSEAVLLGVLIILACVLWAGLGAFVTKTEFVRCFIGLLLFAIVVFALLNKK